MIDIIVPVANQEGTKMIVQTWLKGLGERISKNDPIVEMETDKVMLEVEAPGDGVISEILIESGTEVEPGTLLGRISTSSEQLKSKVEGIQEPESFNHSESAAKPPLINGSGSLISSAKGAGHPIRLSPSVRRFVAKYDLDVSGAVGTGKGGRLTLCDVKAIKETLDKAKVIDDSADSLQESIDLEDPTPTHSTETVCIKHSQMRRAIAKHMSRSVAVAPHVTAVFEADFSAIAAHRTKHKEAFASKGVKLTYTAYFIMACVSAMKVAPEVNSRWHDDHLEVFSALNIGVGTALERKGLIVPVIKNTQDKNLMGIAKSLQNITTKARSNQLSPSDLQDGTFTLSNYGTGRTLLATPIIINQPQSAILGIGSLEKRVVVKTIDGQDVLAIRPMAYVSLTIDHRVLDGYQANLWLTNFVETLENWSS